MCVRRSAGGLFGESPLPVSHSAAPFVKVVPVDNRIDVLARAGEINVVQEIIAAHGQTGGPARPTLGATCSCVVLREGEWSWIVLVFPMLQGALEIPGTGFQIRFGIE